MGFELSQGADSFDVSSSFGTRWMDSRFLVVKEDRPRLNMAEIMRVELEDQHEYSLAGLADYQCVFHRPRQSSIGCAFN